MRGHGRYVLDASGEPLLCDDLDVWGAWFEQRENRVVAHDRIGDVRVSTVFLGLDHNLDDEGPPVLWETMIFGGPHDDDQWRYSTREEAVAGHAAAVALVKGVTA